MNKITRFKLIKKAVSCTLVLTSLITCSGCAKEIDCSISGEHVHLYLNEDSKLSRYIDSEKEYIKDLFRTEKTLSMTRDLNIINDNKLYIASDNLEYLKTKVIENSQSRQSYSYGYVYGTYTGYAFGVNPVTGKAEYYHGVHTGWHNGYDWQDISLEEYTSDKVRDITYKFKFYKINNDGSTSSKSFNSLDDIEKEYKYFKLEDLVEKHISDSYYLEKQKEKKK